MSTTILGKFTKQSREVIDYDVDFTKWFAARNLVPASFTVEAEPGITVVSSTRTDAVVKVVLSGGVHEKKYKISVLMLSTSAPVLTREVDFTVTIKDV